MDHGQVESREGKRVVICGSRNIRDYEFVRHFLDVHLGGVGAVTVLSGGAHGADALGERYAHERGHPLEVHKAEWSRYGKGAGMVRNKRMARSADLVIAFWDGTSRGTNGMLVFCKQEHIDHVSVLVEIAGGKVKPCFVYEQRYSPTISMCGEGVG